MEEQRVAVYGCILNDQKKILVVKRSPNESSPNFWEMPGGKLESGEKIEQGIIREVKEETGLDVIPLSLLSSLHDPIKQVNRIAYLCKLENQSQEIRLSAEHSTYAWIDTTDKSHTPLSDLLIKTLAELNK